ncbi:MAG: hypothetical protein ACKOAH_03735, partial [Pirellula sp.]
SVFATFAPPYPPAGTSLSAEKNNRARERDPQVSPGIPKIKVSNSHTLWLTAAKSEQPVFLGGAGETDAENVGELTASAGSHASVVYASCANWPTFLNQHGTHLSRAII